MSGPNNIRRVSIALGVFLVFSCSDDDPVARINTGIGNVFQTEIYSPGLEGNLLGDNPYRSISVYLPPGYYAGLEERYPVLYMLHHCQEGDRWLFGENDWSYSSDLRPVLDDMIKNGEIQPMILVAPNTRNINGQTWCVNSSVTGQWEDFMVKDLLNFVDDNFRTIPAARSRGVAGVYSGAHAAMRLALLHSDKFAVVYGSTVRAFAYSPMNMNDVARFYAYPSHQIRDILTWTQAFLPRPDIEENYSEIPQTFNYEIKQDILERLRKNELMSMIDRNVDNLKQLTALQFDCCMGTIKDAKIRMGKSRAFSQKLDDFGVEHTFLQHSNAEEEPDRIINHILPFFSEHLEGE